MVEARDAHDDCVCSLECSAFFPCEDAVSGRVSVTVLSEACDLKGGGWVGGGLLGEPMVVLDTDPDRLCDVPFLELGIGGSGLFGGGDVLVGGIVSCRFVEGSLVVMSLTGRGGGGKAILRPGISRLSISNYQAEQPRPPNFLIPKARSSCLLPEQVLMSRFRCPAVDNEAVE